MAPRRDNLKAVEARERKAQQAQQKKEAEAKAKEDAKWKDDGGKIQRQKDQRKQEAELKAEEARRRKEERLALEKAELEAFHKGANRQGVKAAPKRLTQFEILQRLAKQAKENAAAGAAAASSPSVKVVSVTDEELVPNINHQRRAEVLEALLAGEKIIDTTGIDQTLQELGEEDSGGRVDMHPERRARAAFKAFEEREMARLRVEFPELKRSQLNERIHKLWLKSPENPMLKE